MSNFVLQPKHALQMAVGVSLLILLGGAWLVLCRWYPQPFWQASGVFGIAAYAVLAHLGVTALLLLPWRNRSKDAGGVRADTVFLLFVMICAALFSLSFLFAGRPVALVFAVDRVALVRANEVRSSEFAFIDSFSKDLRTSGPLQLIAVRPSSDDERLNSIQLAMAGFDLHQRPGFWVDIEAQRRQLIQKARGVGELDGSFAGQLGVPAETRAKWSIFLPLAGAPGDWVLLLDDELKEFAPAEVQ